MLILSRKVKQKIVIGDNVEVEVLKVSRSKVVLGINAPSDVRVRRIELDTPPDGEHLEGVDCEQIKTRSAA